MRSHCALLLCCLFISVSPSTGLGESALHTFTTPDGRSLNAVIKGYSDQNGKIQIEREDGKKLWVLATVFSEPDREYIRQWIAADQFMSPAKFKIKADSTKDQTSKSENIRGDEVKLEDKTAIMYEITLENKTGFPLKDLKIEYRAFIMIQGYEGNEDSNRVDGGELSIAEIPAGKQVSQKTQPINAITTYRIVSENDPDTGLKTSYGQKTHREHLKGFWIKVYGPAIDGIPAIREWCYPSDVSKDFAWQDNLSNHAP